MHRLSLVSPILLIAILLSGAASAAPFNKVERPALQLRESAGHYPSPELIKINPPHPTTDDQVTILVAGESSNSCAPYDASMVQWGNVFFITALSSWTPYVMCAMVITPWRFEFSVGRLPQGTYNVIFFVHFVDMGYIARSDSTEFTVSPPGTVIGPIRRTSHTYLPLICREPVPTPTPRPTRYPTPTSSVPIP